MIKKIFPIMLLIIITIIILPNVLAVDFNNAYSYNYSTNTATFYENQVAKSNDIPMAKATLNTPQNYEVGVGTNVKVAEFTITNYGKDRDNVLKSLDLFNKKDGMKKINKAFEWKYKTIGIQNTPKYVQQEVQTYNNGTVQYEQVQNGTEEVQIDIWNKLTPADLKTNQVMTIALFTDTTEGENVEWIPTLYGIYLEEWAEWTAGLETNLLGLWELNETSGTTAIDSHTTGLDGTTVGATVNQTGHLDKAYDFDGNEDYVSIPNSTLQGLTSFSFSTWFNPDVVTGDPVLFGQDNKGVRFGWIKSTGNYINCHFKDSAGTTYEVTSTTAISASSWYHLVCTYDGTNMKLYLDDSLEDTQPYASKTTDDTSRYLLAIGGWGLASSIALDYNGLIDQTGLWDRALSSTEVTQLYNGGLGIEYGVAATAEPFPTIHNPTNTTYSTKTINLDVSANDTVNVWEYSLNGGSKTVFTPNTTITAIEGLNSIEVSVNGSLDVYHNTTQYFTVSIAPEVIDVTYEPLDLNREDVGLEFNTTFLEEIEYSQLNFTLRDDTGINDVWTLYYTANGTNSCSPGNRQIGTCYNESGDKWIQFINGTTTNTFKGEGDVGDFINCDVNTINSTWKEYSCIIDEHYNPNIMKWYSADYDFTDIKYQTTNGAGLIRTNDLVRVPLAGIVPLNADQYKLDFRVSIPVGTTSPLEAYACNSTYTTGNPQINQNCVIVASQTPATISANGDKFRAIFTKELVDTLGNGQYIVLRSGQTGTTQGYGIKTFGIQNVSHTQKWEFSSDNGGSWASTADGYETEMNINWFVDGGEQTGFVYKINSSDTLGNTANSTTYNSTWVINAEQNYPPIIILENPIDEASVVGTININWTEADPNDDELEITINAYNGTTTLIKGGIPNGTKTITYNTLGLKDGNYNLSVLACENATAEGYCNSDNHTITVNNDVIIVTLEQPINNQVLVSGSNTFSSSVTMGGSQIENASLYTNKTGTWALTQTDNIIGDYGVILYNNTAISPLNAGAYKKELTYDFNNYITNGTSTADNKGNTMDVIYQFIYTDATQQNQSYNYALGAGTLTWTNPSTTKKVDEMNIWVRMSASTTELIGPTTINGYNYTSSKTVNITETITEGVIWNVEYCTTLGECNFSITNFTALVDTTAPIINITYPIGTLSTTGTIGKTENLNWTITEALPDTCWYDYNNVNYTASSCTSNDTFSLVEQVYDITLWANDTSGNTVYDTTSWDYKIFFYEQNYSNTTTEANIETFSANVTTGTGLSIADADLIYDGDRYQGNLFVDGNNYLTQISTFVVPGTVGTENRSVYWSYLLSDGSIINLTTVYQVVTPLGIDDCSVYTNVLYNFTLVNEKTQVILSGTGDNTSIEVDLDLYSSDRTLQLNGINQTFTNTNPIAICFENALTPTDEYNLDLQIQYGANGYAKEFYHIQKETITDADINTSITLYDLDNVSSQTFKLTYKDSSFLPIEEALVIVNRKYIGETAFKTVEIGKTDNAGQTLVHLELEDVVYTFIIVKDGEILGTFNDRVAYCPNPTFTECEIQLNSVQTDVIETDYASIGEVSFTINANSTSRIIDSDFVVRSGTTGTLSLNVTRFDALGNTTVCTDIIVSTSGTLSCGIPAGFGNTTYIANLYLNGDHVGQKILKVGQNPEEIYGRNIVIISLSAFLTLIGITLVGNPIIALFGLIISAVLLITLNLVASAGIIGAGATILWFIIAVIIIMIKGANR